MRRIVLISALCLVAAGCSQSADPPTSTAPRTTTATPSATSASTPPAAPPSSSSTSTPPTTVDAATTTSVAQRPLDAPPSFDRWTAIFASLPVDEYDFAAAEQFGRETGFFEIGVLLSDDYPSLNPGFWVVFSGTWDQSWWAQERCDRVAEDVPDCYPRYLGIDPAQPIGRPHGMALALDEEADLVAVSLETGEVIRTISQGFGGDGRYPGVPQLHRSGTTAYYSIGVEDSWFSCEASDGQLVAMDLTTGRATEIGSGYSPRISPDGRSLLYLAASDCLPDPEEPANFVITPIDTVVIRDLDTGRESRHAISAPDGLDYGVDYDLWSATWSASGGFFVLGTDGAIRYFETPSSGVLVAEVPDGPGTAWSLHGYDLTRDGVLVQREIWTDSDLHYEFAVLDPTTGVFRPLDEFGELRTAALDASGEHLIALTATHAYVDGAELPLSDGLLFVAW